MLIVLQLLVMPRLFVMIILVDLENSFKYALIPSIQLKGASFKITYLNSQGLRFNPKEKEIIMFSINYLLPALIVKKLGNNTYLNRLLFMTTSILLVVSN